MKIKNFRIKPRRTAIDQQNDFSLNAPRYHTYKKINSGAQTPDAQPQHYKQLLDIFSLLVNKVTNARDNHEISTREDLQPRDREMLVDPSAYFKNGLIEKKNLKKWVAQVFKRVFSASFNYFSKNEMSFEQAKIYCSQNIFKNLVVLNSKYILSPSQFEMLDTYIEDGVLYYLQKKYPLTDSKEINKKLEELVDQVDNIEALSNNYLVNSEVQFEYRDDGNYNDLIMRFVNEVKDRINKEGINDETNFENFQEYMRNIFEKVTDLDWMNNEDSKSQQNAEETLEERFLKGVQSQTQKKVFQALISLVKRQSTEKEQYKSEVKDYTHYLIGRKIPENTENFTEKQIKNRNITMKNPTILRILTKWCDQLWKKYDEVGYYTNRSQSVKDLKGGNTNSLLSWMRKSIDKRLSQQKLQIIKFMEDLCENNYEMQSRILEIEIDAEDGGDYIEDEERISGKFCCKIVKNLHSYIIAYLNRLIHGLLKVGKEFHEENRLFQFSFWPSPPNLLSFHVSDLMRCKISSKQRQIIRIYKQIDRLSKQQPDKFKIVRIKNRLKRGTNDVLINVKFNNCILCEIQLSIKNEISDFIKCSNLFHHYIYELKRSTFGPLTELCSIWKALDERTIIYEELIEKQYDLFQERQHKCQKQSLKVEMARFSRSFICCGCNRPFFHNNYLKNHIKCKNCDYHICSNCQIYDQDQAKLVQQLIKNEDLRKYVKKRIRQDENLPDHGLCIFLQRKNPRIQLFQYVKYQRNRQEYLFTKKNGTIKQIDNIKTQQTKNDFRNKHLIFQLDIDCPMQQVITKKDINKYILTQVMKANYRKEKQSISLMGEGLDTEGCRDILAVGTLSQKQSVKNLFLADNTLTQLPMDPRDFPNLFWLTLSRNVFTSFEGFDRFIRLKNLTWNAGQLQQIPQSIFNLGTLKELQFSKNQITVLSPDIQKLRTLRILKLDGNGLTELPKEIQKCYMLTSLNLEGNKLTQLPSSLFTLERLEELLVNSNLLTEIPKEICLLKKLKQFAVAKNTEINKFPEDFTTLENLQILDCSSTQIANLPQNIHNLKNLKTLDIEHTNIKKFPQNFKLLFRLEKLIMSNLKNFEISSQISQLHHLKNIKLNGCSINKLPNLQNLQKLTSLDLSNNNFQIINEDVFGRLNYLSKLKLFYNKFTIFPAIQKLQRLTLIDLSHNSIKQIPDNINKNSFLEQFIMTNNYLTKIPFTFRQLSRLRKIDLSQNQLQMLIDVFYEDDINKMETPLWPYLTYINLSKNKFKIFPSFLCRCDKLEELFVSNNELVTFPKYLSKLKNLQQLEAKENLFEQIPEQIECLQNLVEIDFSSNKIKRINSIMKKLPNLKVFNVNKCEISDIECPEYILENMHRLNFGGLTDVAKKIKHSVSRSALQKKSDSTVEVPELEYSSAYFDKRPSSFETEHIIEK